MTDLKKTLGVLWPGLERLGLEPCFLPTGGRVMDDGRVWHVFPDPSSQEARRSVGLPCPLIVLREGTNLPAGLLAQALSIAPEEGFLILRHQVGKNPRLSCYRNGLETVLSVKYLPSQALLFDRHKGLLEVSDLVDSKVLILGCGSLGSLTAQLLAQSGVGRFILVDNDVVEAENLSRHTAGMNQMGRRKVDAVKESLQQKNPWVEVQTLHGDMGEIDIKALIRDCSLCVVGTDNKPTRFQANQACVKTRKPLVIGRVLQRGVGGDVFWFWPGYQETCFACLYGGGFFSNENEEISSIKSADRNLPAYSEKETAVWAGLAVDIAPVPAFMARLALITLTHGKPSGYSGWMDDFAKGHGFFFQATRREGPYEGKMTPLCATGAKPGLAPFRWYGVKTEAQLSCAVCGLEMRMREELYAAH